MFLHVSFLVPYTRSSLLVPQEYDPVKYREFDSVAAQCHACKNYYPRRGDWRKCGACGADRLESEWQVSYPRPLRWCWVANGFLAFS